MVPLADAGKEGIVVARRGNPTGVDPCLTLCRSAVDFYMCDNTTTYVPFEADRMAEPPSDITPLNMLSVLPRQLAALYANEDNMMKYYEDRKANAIIMNGRYNKIMGDRSEYLKYLNNPTHWPLWDLQPCESVEATCTVAAVAKKDGVALRKILMLCPFNEWAVTVDELNNWGRPWVWVVRCRCP